MEQKIINIKWETGEMEFSVRDFLDLFPSPEKCRYMADLAKKSDRDFGTDAVSEMLVYCSRLLDSHKTSAQDWEYRRKTSVYAAVIELFIQELNKPLPVQIKAKRLF